MHKSLVLVLAAACGAASAQTPANNPMPDGSRDMYVGLGIVSTPEWDGARSRKERALPVLQVQWSNGFFVSGMSAGMHLSDRPSVEYGPLVTVLAKRDASGNGNGLGGMSGEGVKLQPSFETGDPAARLDGIKEIGARLEVGGFFNHYLNERLRVNNTIGYGAGHDRRGLRYTIDLQHLAADLAPRHKVSASAGLTFVNSAHNRAYFGISDEEALLSRRATHVPGGGLRDVHAGVRWNYALSPSWILASQLQVTHLRGDAAKSPLVERSTNYTVSTALAYRF
ncbi:MipA/OmpV family protein [Pseudoduganella sp. GCM10020061]|uniref:MipA/OmpV family protein n=1 Tax=Pseudoduganella sp. GCM10020061 TaxID=3317345 RepID=UPI00362C2900